jgi:allantoinase
MVHALRSRRVITPHGEQDAAVVIDAEHIAAIKPLSELSANIPVEDLGNLALLPGLIDVHTHINEPGRTEWEGFATATRAAAAGGFTTLIDMPLNCLPETTTIAALELKREAASSGGPNGTPQCMIDYAFWGGCVDGNQHHLEPLALAGVAGFKSFLIYPGCDGFTSIDRANLERAIPHIARTGLPLLVHAELEPAISAAVAHLNATGADWREYATYLASRPDVAELDAIEMLLELCREHCFRLHIVHLSTAKALPLIAAAKREGLPVSVETCPHFLHFTAETIPANPNGPTLCKSAPAIRSAANREALWQALRDGTIDLIATDHSPCPPHMKRLHAEHAQPGEAPAALVREPGHQPGRFDLAWGGIPSLSTALSVLWTECTRRELTLSQLAQWTSAAPAHLAGLATQVGSIEPGKHANLVAFDADASFTLTSDMLHYRHKISPYLGETLRGLVRSTWLRGQRVFSRGAATSGDTFAVTAPGREYALSFSLDHQSLSR